MEDIVKKKEEMLHCKSDIIQCNVYAIYQKILCNQKTKPTVQPLEEMEKEQLEEGRETREGKPGP